MSETDSASPFQETTTVYGHRVFVDPEDFIGRRILRNGIFIQWPVGIQE